MNPLNVLNSTVFTTIAAQGALIGLTVFVTWFVLEWYWTRHCLDAASTAHFAQANWNRRFLIFGGVLLFAVLYLVLLLK